METYQKEKRGLENYLIPKLKDDFCIKKIEVNGAVLSEVESSFGTVIENGNILGPVEKKRISEATIKEIVESSLQQRRWETDRKLIEVEGHPQLRLFFLKMEGEILKKLETPSKPETLKYTLKDNSKGLTYIIGKSRIGDIFDLDGWVYEEIKILNNRGELRGWIPSKKAPGVKKGDSLSKEIVKVKRGNLLESKLRRLSNKEGVITKTESTRRLTHYQL